MMALFRSQLHQDIWIEHHCKRCYFYTAGCGILQKALRTNRKPVEWDRNTRTGALMAETIRCNSESRQPPRVERPIIDVDVPMFDVETVAGPMDSDHA